MTSTTVRDPIHGMIELAPAEWKAVDTPVYQRLRSIRQLAMTHLVYPGAVHSRFEHSIGARHVAAQLAGRPAMGLDDDHQRVVRIAALLHDVGHGPFSHVSEQVIDELAEVHGVHEAVSVYVMRNDPHLRAALGEEDLNAAAAIVGLEGPRSAARDIVSGPTDSDKLDYLLRDSYFAGVKYGEYDLGRVVDSARVIAPMSAQTQLGFDADGVWAVEGLLMARHHMHRQVYGHKTRLSTDIMVTRALKMAVEEGVLDETAYRVQVEDTNGRRKPLITDEFVGAYLEQTDARVLEAMLGAPEGSPVRDLAERLTSRELLRQTGSVRLDQRKHDLGSARYAAILDPDTFTPERVAKSEAAIASALGQPAHLIALYIDVRSNPTYRQPGGRIGAKDVMLQRRDEEPQILQAESEIFREYVGGDEHSWAHLYTPTLDDGHDQNAKELLWDTLKEV